MIRVSLRCSVSLGLIAQSPMKITILLIDTEIKNIDHNYAANLVALASLSGEVSKSQ